MTEQLNKVKLHASKVLARFVPAPLHFSFKIDLAINLI